MRRFGEVLNFGSKCVKRKTQHLTARSWCVCHGLSTHPQACCCFCFLSAACKQGKPMQHNYCNRKENPNTQKNRWERCLRLQVFITISFEMSLTDDRAWAPSTHCNGSLHSVSWSTVFFFHIFFRIAVSFFLPFHCSEPDAYVTGGWFSKEFQKERT